MRTVDTEVTSTDSRWVKFRTDAALLVRLARMVFSYATEGRRTRRLYRTAQASGQVLWVDDLEASRRRLG